MGYGRKKEVNCFFTKTFIKLIFFMNSRYYTTREASLEQISSWWIFRCWEKD